jgi:hypothetical protein
VLGACGSGGHSSASTTTGSTTLGPTTTATPSTSTPASTTAPTTAAPGPPTTVAGSCATTALRVSLGSGQGAAGSTYVNLLFTNTGSTTCTMAGFPGVSYVTGPGGTQIGQAAQRSGSSGTPVNLAPGAVASATLRQVNVQNYPAADCTPTPAAGLLVYPPGQITAAYVAFSAPGTGCATGTGAAGQLTIGGVAAGSSGTPT